MSASASAPQSILIIEGQPGSARHIRPALKATRRQTAVTSAETFHHEAPIQADLIVLADTTVTLPLLDLCRQLKQDDTPDYLPVIVVTEEAEPGHWADALGAGADEFLVAPVAADLLAARVTALLGVRRRFAELQRRNERMALDLAERDRQLAAAVAQETRSLAILKTAIIRNVSHELRTPVLQVKSSVALLKEFVAQDEPATRLITFAVKSIGRLENVVTNITQFVESQNLKMEPIALNDSVDMAIRNLERSWHSGEDYKRIKKRYDPNTPLVMADRRGVAQVLQHLLDNALKFSPGGGPVEILIEPRGDDTVWIGVRDHGIGIQPDQLGRIFESFYQVDGSTTREFNGVGVGLTLARLIADRMNTTIDVKSVPRKGSTFSFVLPRAAVPHP